jgi:hypothetical protein
MLATRKLFGSRTASCAGLIGALAPPALFLPTLFWETSLSVLLATALFALGLRCGQNAQARDWIAFGALAAAALSVNPSLLLIAAGCFGWAAYQSRSRSRLAPVAGLLLGILLSAPWAIRNAYQLHAFVPFRSNAGYELWQGNRPGSDGFFLADLHPNVNAKEFQRYESLGEVGYMHEKSLIAMGWITADPGRFVKLTLERGFYFWTGVVRKSSSLVVAYITTTSVLGFLGLGLIWRGNKALATYFLLPLILFPIPYSITHPDYRFRLVIDPLLVALTACTLTGRKTHMDGEPAA